MRVIRIASASILLLLSSARPNAQGGEDPAARTAARIAIDDGRYRDAERLARDELATLQRTSDARRSALVTDVLVEALTKGGSVGELTRRLAERQVVDKSALFGGNSLELADSQDNLGALLSERGEFADALKSLERALAIRRSAHDNPGVAGSLERLAVPLIWLERFPEAERALSDARSLRESSPTADPLVRARTFYLEALLHRWDGQYEQATAALDQASRLRQGLAVDHPDVIAARELEGDLRFLRGGMQDAERIWIGALGSAERRLGPAHPAVPRFLRRLAIVAQEQGDFGRRQQLLEQALAVAHDLQAPCYPELPALLNSLGALSAYRGEFQRARDSYNEALRKFRQCYGASHSMTTTTLYNTADLAAEMGDVADAEQLYRQVIREWSRRLGADHPYIARGLDALAGVVAARGRTAEATQLLNRALQMRSRALGPDSPDVAFSLVTLAGAVARRSPATALQHVDRAIAIYQRDQLIRNAHSLAVALLLRGTLLQARGRYQDARTAFTDALAERERAFGTDHPLTGEARAELAASEFALGLADTAVRDALDAEQVGRNHLRFTIRYLPERQALAYADKRPRGLDLALSAVADGSAPQNAAVLDALIRSRGIVLDELGARVHVTAESTDPAIAALNAAATTARERFANLMMRSLTDSEPVSRAVLDQARTAKEEAERSLAERSATTRGEIERANLGLPAVRDGLPDGAALVSFVRYTRTTVNRATTPAVPRDTPSYLAFVIRAGSPRVDAVPLGSAPAIDQLVAALRKQLEAGSLVSVASADAERAYRAAGAAVRRRVWDPLAPLLREVSQVLVVPDGSLNLVSFAALPTTSARYLVDDGPLVHYLSTERDLLSRDTSTSARGLLAVGGPSFGTRVSAPPPSAPLSVGCPTPGRVYFEDLPGSRIEAAEVARIWSAVNGTADTTVVSGRAATTSTIKQGATGRRVIHLATHGFFLQPGCGTAAAGIRGIGGVGPPRAKGTPPPENPFLLAGLAFAGANVRRAAATADDGILTAEEVAGLNLQGTEWVVLSACDTGLGELKAGEGVLGLRRAFQVAGARTIIMSLWSVEDRSTQRWMRYLYEARFNGAMSTSASVQAASRRVLAERRSRRASTHPFFWAGFVAAGGWQ